MTGVRDTSAGTIVASMWWESPTTYWAGFQAYSLRWNPCLILLTRTRIFNSILLGFRKKNIIILLNQHSIEAIRNEIMLYPKESPRLRSFSLQYQVKLLTMCGDSVRDFEVLSPKWNVFIPGIYAEEKKWKDLKSQRWLMAWRNQHFPNKTEPRQIHIWTQRDCDNTHKFCRRTKLDNIPTWRGRMNTNYHPIKAMALQIHSCWKRKSQFSSKRGTLVKPALLKCRLQAQEKQHTWYHGLFMTSLLCLLFFFWWRSERNRGTVKIIFKMYRMQFSKNKF